MTGVPGGDVPLHAAITETLAGGMEHADRCDLADGMGSRCDCGLAYEAARLASRVLAVLADGLPRTPEALPALLGRGYVAVEPPYQAAEHGHKATPCKRYVTPKRGGWVPGSPPAAPEPRQDT